MRVVFMGSPDFSVPTLQALIDAGHEIVAVYSQPPRAAGRGKQLRPTPVHAVAEANGLLVRTPLNFKNGVDVADFTALRADVAVVIAYGLILPQSILDAPRLGCVNLHASLLPRWRGAAPIHRAIMAGDCETGVCLMAMEAGLDTGPVMARVATPIAADDTTGEMHTRLAAMSADILIQNIDQLETLRHEPQPEDGVTYAAKIDKSEAEIDWAHPAETVRNHIHGLSPFPGAWAMVDGERIKFLSVEVTADSAQAGTIIDDQFSIACGMAAIRGNMLQRAGKRPMARDEFLRGFTPKIGTKIGTPT